MREGVLSDAYIRSNNPAFFNHSFVEHQKHKPKAKGMYRVKKPVIPYYDLYMTAQMTMHNPYDGAREMIFNYANFLQLPPPAQLPPPSSPTGTQQGGRTSAPNSGGSPHALVHGGSPHLGPDDVPTSVTSDSPSQGGLSDASPNPWLSQFSWLNSQEQAFAESSSDVSVTDAQSNQSSPSRSNRGRPTNKQSAARDAVEALKHFGMMPMERLRSGMQSFRRSPLSGPQSPFSRARVSPVYPEIPEDTAQEEDIPFIDNQFGSFFGDESIRQME